MKHKKIIPLLSVALVIVVALAVVFFIKGQKLQVALEKYAPVTYPEFVDKFAILERLAQENFTTSQAKNHFVLPDPRVVFGDEGDMNALNNDLTKPTTMLMRVKSKNPDYAHIESYIVAFFAPNIRDSRYIGSLSLGSLDQNVVESLKPVLGMHKFSGGYWITDGMVFGFQQVGIESLEAPPEYHNLFTEIFVDFKDELAQ